MWQVQLPSHRSAVASGPTGSVTPTALVARVLIDYQCEARLWCLPSQGLSIHQTPEPSGLPCDLRAA